MSKELLEKISELTIENDRIKKTSKQRFDKNKKLESEMKYLKMQNDRMENIKSWLRDKGFKPAHHQGLFRCDWSVFRAINSLTNKAVKLEKPSVDGTYAVKIDGEWSIQLVRMNLCWGFFDSQTERHVGIHSYNTEEFIYLRLNQHIKREGIVMNKDKIKET